MNLVKIRSFQQSEMAAIRAAHGHKSGTRKAVEISVRHHTARRISANLILRRSWRSKIWTWENN